jgi:hypothetical protein
MFTSGEAATAFDAAQPMIYHTEAALTRTKIALQKLRSHEEEAHASTVHPISLEALNITSSTRLQQ